METFERLIDPTDESSIIDLGGAEDTWELISARPTVAMVNVWGNDYRNGRFRYEIGDACALRYPDGAFNIAFSNSVIEHVGDWDRQQQFASEVRRVAPRYFVQTPNKFFPVEPHFLCVGIHLLPKRMLRRLLRYGSLWGLTTKPSQEDIDRFLLEIRLLTKTEMQQLFPDAEIIEEKFFGLTKSILAVKR